MQTVDGGWSQERLLPNHTEKLPGATLVGACQNLTRDCSNSSPGRAVMLPAQEHSSALFNLLVVIYLAPSFPLLV